VKGILPCNTPSDPPILLERSFPPASERKQAALFGPKQARLRDEQNGSHLGGFLSPGKRKQQSSIYSPQEKEKASTPWEMPCIIANKQA
jgi:hypothetical protein